MKFQNAEWQIDLWIDGYEVNDSKQYNVDEIDLNWLLVGVSRRRLPDGKFHTERDACLLTWERSTFLRALRELRSGRSEQAEGDFLEPVLGLTVNGTESGYSVRISYLTSQEDGEGNFRRLEQEFALTAQQLEQWMSEWTESEKLFPRR